MLTEKITQLEASTKAALAVKDTEILATHAAGVKALVIVREKYDALARGLNEMGDAPEKLSPRPEEVRYHDPTAYVPHILTRLCIPWFLHHNKIFFLVSEKFDCFLVQLVSDRLKPYCHSYLIASCIPSP